MLGLYPAASPSRGYQDDDGGLYVNDGQSRHQVCHSGGPFGPAENLAATLSTTRVLTGQSSTIPIACRRVGANLTSRTLL